VLTVLVEVHVVAEDSEQLSHVEEAPLEHPIAGAESGRS